MASFDLDFQIFITYYVIPHLTNDIIVFNHLKIIIWTFKEWCIHWKWTTLVYNHWSIVRIKCWLLCCDYTIKWQFIWRRRDLNCQNDSQPIQWQFDKSNQVWSRNNLVCYFKTHFKVTSVYFPRDFNFEMKWENYELSKLCKTQLNSFKDSHFGNFKKKPFGCNFDEDLQNTLQRKRWCHFPSWSCDENFNAQVWIACGSSMHHLNSKMQFLFYYLVHNFTLLIGIDKLCASLFQWCNV